MNVRTKKEQELARTSEGLINDADGNILDKIDEEAREAPLIKKDSRQLMSDNDEDDVGSEQYADYSEEESEIVHERLYYIDWMRAVAIELVVLVHCISQLYYEGNITKETDRVNWEKKNGALRALLQLGIPLFFYISGVAAKFYNVDKGSFPAYTADKIKRLVLPMLFAIPIFLWPRNYLDQGLEGRIGDEVIQNPLRYFVRMMAVLPSMMSWLWFLVALFLVAVINYPLVAWTYRRSRQRDFEVVTDGSLIFLHLALMTGYAFFCLWMVDIDHYGRKFLVPACLIQVISLMLFYGAQFWAAENETVAFFARFIGPAMCLVLNICKIQHAEVEFEMYEYLLAFIYHMNFFAQGLFDLTYQKQQNRMIGMIS